MKPIEKQIPEVIPPLSEVRLILPDENTPCWKTCIGTRYRIGYYSPQDGLDVIWLVDDAGDYRETTDREYLLKYFEIESLSNETDYFGENRRPIAARKVD